MACACKVNRQLSNLKKEYGVNAKEDEKISVKISFRKIITGFCVLLLSPFIFTYILSIALFSKSKMIDIRKIFLRKHGK